MTIKAWLDYQPRHDSYDLYIRSGERTAFISIAADAIPKNGMVPKLLTGDIAKDFVQAIMDAGWKAGLRPLGYEDASRELAATKYHLEDMRYLHGVKK